MKKADPKMHRQTEENTQSSLESTVKAVNPVSKFYKKEIGMIIKVYLEIN